MSSALNSKNIMFLGSSVTYGSASGGVSMVEVISEKCGCNCVKHAVSGTTLADIGERSYVRRLLNEADRSAHVDHFVCQLSTNDASQKVEIGEISKDGEGLDVTTTAGAIEFIIDFVKKTWGCDVSFYTNPRFDNPRYDKMVELIYEISNRYDGVSIIDLWNNKRVNTLSEEEQKLYMSDALHPTYAGYRDLWSDVFIEHLEKQINK